MEITVVFFDDNFAYHDAILPTVLCTGREIRRELSVSI